MGGPGQGPLLNCLPHAEDAEEVRKQKMLTGRNGSNRHENSLGAVRYSFQRRQGTARAFRGWSPVSPAVRRQTEWNSEIVTLKKSLLSVLVLLSGLTSIT